MRHVTKHGILQFPRGGKKNPTSPNFQIILARLRLRNVPWQSDRTQVPQRVVHQLELLYADQPAQDPEEVL